MKIPYPKTAREIEITAQPIHGAGAADRAPFRLSDKIIEYLFSADLPRSQVLSAVEELMMTGRVEIYSNRLSERLQLLDPEDLLTVGQTRSLFQDFIQEASERLRRWTEKPAQ